MELDQRLLKCIINKMTKNTATGAVYGFGLIGVLVYYLQNAKTFVEVILGILKSIVWPALLTYKIFGFLKIS